MCPVIFYRFGYVSSNLRLDFSEAPQASRSNSAQNAFMAFWQVSGSTA